MLVNESHANEDSLIDRIDQAQKHLSSTENRIADARQRMASQINRLEREVLALREKAAVAQRLADEKTLSLSKLEKRLENWRQQQVYQQNLLHRFLQQNGTRVTTNRSGADSMTVVITEAKILRNRFQPTWQTADIVLPSGEISTLPTLGIGPVTWYWDENAERAGLASVHDSTQGVLHSDILLDASDSKGLAALRQQARGELVFDPTLSRAMAREQHAESLLEHLMKGGLWAVPILLFALFALSIALIKATQLWRLPTLVRFTPASLQNALTTNAGPLTTNVKGMQATLLNIAHNEPLPSQRDDQLFMQLQDDRRWLDRWIGAIAITAAVSPLLGLLGTVSGMIETFKMMTLFGSGDPEVVSGGIAQALVTTELGLVVAIPALILNAVLSRRAKTYYNDLESFAILLSKTDNLVVNAPVNATPNNPPLTPSPQSKGVAKEVPA